jgi:hypothetical protein
MTKMGDIKTDLLKIILAKEFWAIGRFRKIRRGYYPHQNKSFF